MDEDQRKKGRPRSPDDSEKLRKEIKKNQRMENMIGMLVENLTNFKKGCDEENEIEIETEEEKRKRQFEEYQRETPTQTQGIDTMGISYTSLNASMAGDKRLRLDKVQVVPSNIFLAKTNSDLDNALDKVIHDEEEKTLTVIEGMETRMKNQKREIVDMRAQNQSFGRKLCTMEQKIETMKNSAEEKAKETKNIIKNMIEENEVIRGENAKMKKRIEEIERYLGKPKEKETSKELRDQERRIRRGGGEERVRGDRREERNQREEGRREEERGYDTNEEFNLSFE